MTDTRLFDRYLEVEAAALWGDPIQDAFERFHHNHPEVMDALVRLAFDAKAAGRNRIGIGMLFEVVRWERIIAGLPDEKEGFKLNNNYRSRYARRIMEDHPALEGIFATRELRS